MATVIIAGAGYAWWWGCPVPPVLRSVDPGTLTCAEPSLLVESLLTLALTGMTAGRWTPAGAIAVVQQALAVADDRGTSDDRGFARYFLGSITGSTGDRVSARRWVEEARGYLEEGATGRFYTDYELGWIELTDGNATPARRYFEGQVILLEARSGWEIQRVHMRAGLAVSAAAEGDRTTALAQAAHAVEEARTIALPSIEAMALVRSAEAAAILGAPVGPELPAVLRLLRAQGTLRWVAAALTIAAVAHEAAGNHIVAARLLGGAAAVAESLGEQPLPLPAVAAVVAATRLRLNEALGIGPLTDAERAGRNIPVPDLLYLALDALDT